MDQTNSGNAEWLRSVIERFESPLIRYAASLTGNAECARDAVQDTFVRLCGQDAAKLHGRLAQWLFTVCRNRALDLRRKESRLTALAERDLEAEQGTDDSPSDAMERSESASDLIRLLATLPGKQQEVVRLKFQGGMSYEEISRATKLSVSNVGFLLHTAIKTLRTKMHALEQGEISPNRFAHRAPEPEWRLSSRREWELGDRKVALPVHGEGSQR